MAAPKSSEVQTVMVQFVSKLESLDNLPPTPFAVPITLAREGLSEIVNSLLEQDPPRSYDFLVTGEFLRTSLRQYLTAKSLSEEHTIELEVVESISPPEEQPSQPHPDWVYTLDASIPGLIVTGCYDGIVRVFTPEEGKGVGKPVHQGSGHSSAIKAVRWFRPKGEQELGRGSASSSGKHFMVSASKDRTARVWKLDGHGLTCLARCPSVEAVEAVAVLPTFSDPLRFCSGGMDKKVSLWAIPCEGLPEDEDDAQPSSKKRKTKKSEAKNSRPAPTAKAVLSLEGHTQGVSALAWPHELAIYSGSMDHSIRLWDVTTGKNTNTWHGTKAITSLDFSENANMILTSHNDALIRLWDPRKSGKEVISLTLKGHKGWVNGVAWSPLSAHLLASASYDQSIKLWDIRSTTPLFSLQAHKDKALCVGFQGASQLLSGGADCQLRLHALSGLSA